VFPDIDLNDRTTMGPEKRMLRIVIANSDELLTRWLTSALSRVNGLEVVGTAREAVKTLEVLFQTNPDVLLIDFSLPPTDGPDLIVAIKGALPRIKVVAITGDADQGTVEGAVRAGADGFITSDGSIEPIDRGLRLLVCDQDGNLGRRDEGGQREGALRWAVNGKDPPR
jgi:DNA-binding NarL/FixJ family response regulator